MILGRGTRDADGECGPAPLCTAPRPRPTVGGLERSVLARATSRPRDRPGNRTGWARLTDLWDRAVWDAEGSPHFLALSAPLPFPLPRALHLAVRAYLRFTRKLTAWGPWRQNSMSSIPG